MPAFDALEKRLLDLTLAGGQDIPEANVVVGLFKSEPLDSHDGTYGQSGEPPKPLVTDQTSYRRKGARFSRNSAGAGGVGITPPQVTRSQVMSISGVTPQYKEHRYETLYREERSGTNFWSNVVGTAPYLNAKDTSTASLFHPVPASDLDKNVQYEGTLFVQCAAISNFPQDAIIQHWNLVIVAKMEGLAAGSVVNLRFGYTTGTALVGSQGETGSYVFPLRFTAANTYETFNVTVPEPANNINHPDQIRGVGAKMWYALEFGDNPEHPNPNPAGHTHPHEGQWSITIDQLISEAVYTTGREISSGAIAASSPASVAVQDYSVSNAATVSNVPVNISFPSIALPAGARIERIVMRASYRPNWLIVGANADGPDLTPTKYNFYAATEWTFQTLNSTTPLFAAPVTAVDQRNNVPASDSVAAKSSAEASPVNGKMVGQFVGLLPADLARGLQVRADAVPSSSVNTPFYSVGETPPVLLDHVSMEIIYVILDPTTGNVTLPSATIGGNAATNLESIIITGLSAGIYTHFGLFGTRTDGAQ